jgi:cysteinyl-tRNA synthetase
MGNGHAPAPVVNALSEQDIGRLVTERDEARRQGNYRRGDEIRQELQTAGVILEDSKSGTRWKRK